MWTQVKDLIKYMAFPHIVMVKCIEIFSVTKNVQTYESIDIIYQISENKYAIDYSFHSSDFEYFIQILKIHTEFVENYELFNLFKYGEQKKVTNIDTIMCDRHMNYFRIESKE